jgi:hypothetical protein
VVTRKPFPAIPPGKAKETKIMKELTAEEYLETNGGLLPLLVTAAAVATFAWVDKNWSQIKTGFMDGWRDAAR